MSQLTPPAPTPSPSNNPKPSGPGVAGPGMPAQKPGVTTPMAPPIGASAPPSARTGLPADRAHSGVAQGSAAAPAARPATGAPGTGGNGAPAARPPAGGIP